MLDLALFRYDGGDAIYQGQGTAFPNPAGTNGRYVAHQPAIKVYWGLDDHFTLAAYIAVLIPGATAKSYGMKANDYNVSVAFSYRF